MTNINTAPFQQEFSNTNSTMASNDQAISDNTQITQDSDSNKLWLALLVILAIIVGFWIGFFVNEYFYQGAISQENLMDSVNEQDLEPIVELEKNPTIMENQFIIFNDEEVYLGDAISFLSKEQCVDDEIMVLKAIDEESITLQTNRLNSQEEDVEELAEEVLNLKIRDQDCVELTQEICPDVNIERCFSLTNINEVYHLDYGFEEESINPTVDSEI